MTWQCITANESPSIDRPFEVAARAAELLIANGWTPPEVHQVHRGSQDPTPGPFLLPKEAPCET